PVHVLVATGQNMGLIPYSIFPDGFLAGIALPYSVGNGNVKKLVAMGVDLKAPIEMGKSRIGMPVGVLKPFGSVDVRTDAPGGNFAFFGVINCISHIQIISKKTKKIDA